MSKKNPVLRRDFIRFSSLTGAGFFFGSLPLGQLLRASEGIRPAALANEKIYATLGDYLPWSVEPLVPNPGKIISIDPATFEMNEGALPFYGHSLVQNPRDPSRVIAIFKWGRFASVFNLQTMKTERTFETERELRFNGHGVITPDGKLLITTEQEGVEEKGWIVIRDVETLKVIRKSLSGGAGPHECLLQEDGDTLITANFAPHGKSSNLTWSSLKSGQTIRAFQFDTDERMSHFRIDSSGWIVCGGQNAKLKLDGGKFPRSALTSITPDGHKIRFEPPVLYAKNFRGENTTLVIDEKSSLVFSKPSRSTTIFVWNYKNGHFINALQTKNEIGTIDWLQHGETLIAFRSDGSGIMKVNARTLKVADETSRPGSNLTVGVHMIRLKPVL